MLRCIMRTTVTIDDELLAQAKVLAARTRRTLGSVLEDALREQLRRAQLREATDTFDLPVAGDPTGTPLVDLYDKNAVADALGEHNPRV
jgi:Arc/MetJ family transcription regulator